MESVLVWTGSTSPGGQRRTIGLFSWSPAIHIPNSALAIFGIFGIFGITNSSSTGIGSNRSSHPSSPGPTFAIGASAVV